MAGDFDGLLVVAIEQAVAAPYASGRLADAGARVIKVERPEGDFARDYDRLAAGESAYFVWLNRGKQSIRLDLKDVADAALARRMIAAADVYIQNLIPGAADRLGLGSAAMRAAHPSRNRSRCSPSTVVCQARVRTASRNAETSSTRRNPAPRRDTPSRISRGPACLMA